MRSRKPTRWALTAAALPAVLLAYTPTASAADTPYVGDLGQAIATVVIFALLALLLGRYAWRPIVAQLRRREEAIARQISDAEKREAHAKDLQRLYEARLAAADQDAENIRQESRKQADLDRDQVLADARLDARRLSDQVQDDLQKARDQAIRELNDRTAALAADVAGQLLARELSEEEHRRLQDESIAEIHRRVAEER